MSLRFYKWHSSKNVYHSFCNQYHFFFFITLSVDHSSSSLWHSTDESDQWHCTSEPRRGDEKEKNCVTDFLLSLARCC